MRTFFFFFLLSFAWTGAVWAAGFEIGPGDDLRAAIAALEPGDELVLRGGTYTLAGRLAIDLVGTAARPIVIRAKTGERPRLDRPNADHNIVEIENGEYLELRGIEFSGGSAGIRIMSARYLTIEDCEIHDTADVALRANDTGTVYQSLVIRRNHIHDTGGTGEGMYLGCNNDGCRLRDSVIEGNYVHHTNAAGVEQGDGIELKEGSFDNVIRDNVIHDTNYPCILTYSAAGNGGPNIIERNVLWHCGDHGVQSSADAIIRNNLILSAGSDGIAMQPHQAGAPANLVVVNNTILTSTNDAISIRGNTGTVVVANNALYAENGRAIFVSGGSPGMITLAGNAGVGAAPSGFANASLADLVQGHYLGQPPINLYPAEGGALVAAGAATHLPLDDFDRRPRNGVADIGAYAFVAGAAPGWMIEPDFKPTGTSVPPLPDAGLIDAGSADFGEADADHADGGVVADAGRDDRAAMDAATTDAGLAADAGGEALTSGCGCGATRARTSFSPGLLLFVAAVLVGRRRHPRSKWMH